jgi:hypothetical protein
VLISQIWTLAISFNLVLQPKPFSWFLFWREESKAGTSATVSNTDLVVAIFNPL